MNRAMVACELDPRIAEVLTSGEIEPDLRSLRAPSADRPVADPLVRDDVAPLKGRFLPVRLYQGTRDDCVIVFFHGGGFVKGDLDSQGGTDTPPRLLQVRRDLCGGEGRGRPHEHGVP
ncbi:hypothetical protein IM697_22325 [Streptomyces ferrugineus]|uniref:Alpha/beta hydrolase fold-3 domain-containing protein n=1 Tax=Streptomyces ferrugineus TaxID=1413221 RepID=A0A7M2SZC5_9ACTN|nr:hypothetical protein [Streptomyces ferrugineus]QOV40878.1 hypothetical protein IM697_22325 [Streptomyces ferrugineus]